jgi:hypothetical protein
MGLDGRSGDDEPIANLGVGQAAGDEGEDLGEPAGQVVAAVS